MSSNRKKSSDLITILIYIALVITGVMAIYASIYTQDAVFLDVNSKHFRQIIWAGFSLIIGMLILLVDGNFFSTFAYVFYAIVLFALVLVMFFGQTVSGGQSWFDLGFAKLQPSEFAKFVTCLALTKYVTGNGVKLSRWSDLIIGFVIILIPIVLIILQKDTGTALVFLSLVLVLFRRGMPAWLMYFGIALVFLSIISLLIEVKLLLIIMAVAGVILSLFNLKRNRKIIPFILGFTLLFSAYVFSANYAFENILLPHQQNRINVLIGKVDDVKEAAYNVYQSKIAIGSGGLMGKGYLNGTQTKFNFVPELSTDFIFCTIGEEFGFIGSVFVILLYLALLFRIIFVAERQRSAFSSTFAYCVASIIFFHFLVNIGMTIGLVPVIGIPLPFISYGGSSLLGFTILLFILLKFDTERYNIVR